MCIVTVFIARKKNIMINNNSIGQITSKTKKKTNSIEANN